MIGLNTVRDLPLNAIIWDSGKGAVAGFGARRRNGPGIVYIVKYRTKTGRQRWQVIGRHGVLTPDEARAKARVILGAVADGADPAAERDRTRKASTVAELCDLYFADAKSGRLLLSRKKTPKKASTIATDHGRIERHIKPQLGKLAVADVTSDDIEIFMNAIAEGKTRARVKTKKRGLARVQGGKGTASRTVGLLGAIFTYAVKHKMRADNPVRGVTRPADGRRERRLSEEEYAALGEALRAAETEGKIWPAAVAATRFLALTGWRKGEALALKWPEVEFGRRTARLPETKTGFSMRPLSQAACDVLSRLPRVGANDLVFPATRGDGVMSGFPGLWQRIAKLGKLPADITPHVLRHSFASLAADLGYSEHTIGALIGHKGHTITSRYMHSADAVLLAAADDLANETTARMGYERLAAEVVPLRRRAAANGSN